MKIFAALIAILASLTAAQPVFYPQPPDLDTSRYLVPSDLTYLGAFRMPADRAGSIHGFTYVIGAMTYSPHGDSAADGFPGALVMAGHGSESGPVAKITIPAPIRSRTLAELPRATVIQPFRMFGTFPPQEQRSMGLEEIGETTYITMTDAYLPPPFGGLRIMSWGPRDLSSYGPMRSVGPDRVDCYGDYLFQIPKWWSDKYAPGRFLGMGRHRWGDLCGQGPAIFAMNPHADSPDSADPLTALPMLRYGSRSSGLPPLANYSFGGDYYAAAAFLESGKKSSIILSGYKGLGGGWYGTRCGFQGFHDTLGYIPYLIFYNPDELGRVAMGQTSTHLPQPYAGADLNPIVIPFNVTPCNNFYIHALAYDRARNVLYGVQKYPGENQVVHAWRVKAYAADTIQPPPPPPSPGDTLPPPPPVDSGACLPDTISIQDTLALSAARDSVTMLRDLVAEAAKVQATLSLLADSLLAERNAVAMSLDSLRRRPPETVKVEVPVLRDTLFRFDMEGIQIHIKKGSPIPVGE